MLIRNNTKGRIEDFSESNGVFTLYGNKKAGLDLSHGGVMRRIMVEISRKAILQNRTVRTSI
jgi:hypothetical protein